MRAVALLLFAPALVAQAPVSPTERLADAALAFADAGSLSIMKCVTPLRLA